MLFNVHAFCFLYLPSPGRTSNFKLMKFDRTHTEACIDLATYTNISPHNQSANFIAIHSLLCHSRIVRAVCTRLRFLNKWKKRKEKKWIWTRWRWIKSFASAESKPTMMQLHFPWFFINFSSVLFLLRNVFHSLSFFSMNQYDISSFRLIL